MLPNPQYENGTNSLDIQSCLADVIVNQADSVFQSVQNIQAEYEKWYGSFTFYDAQAIVIRLFLNAGKIYNQLRYASLSHDAIYIECLHTASYVVLALRKIYAQSIQDIKSQSIELIKKRTQEYNQNDIQPVSELCPLHIASLMYMKATRVKNLYDACTSMKDHNSEEQQKICYDKLYDNLIDMLNYSIILICHLAQIDIDSSATF